VVGMRLIRRGRRTILVHRPLYNWGFGAFSAAVAALIAADLLGAQPAAAPGWTAAIVLAGFGYLAARLLSTPRTTITFDRDSRRVTIDRRRLLGRARRHEVDDEAIAGVDVHDFGDEDGDAHRARLLVRNGEPIALTAVSRNRRAAEADRSAAAQALADI
jgi:hypothetical protein